MGMRSISFGRARTLKTIPAAERQRSGAASVLMGVEEARSAPLGLSETEASGAMSRVRSGPGNRPRVSSVQVMLSEYLQYELYHSVGAYNVARDRLRELESRMDQVHPVSGEDPLAGQKLRNVTRLASQFNDQMAMTRHHARRSPTDASETPRYPVPEEFPLSLGSRFNFDSQAPGVEDSRRNPWASPVAWAWVLNFYDAAIAAIDVVEDPDRARKLEESNPPAAQLYERFAESVVWPRDRSSRPDHNDEDIDERERRRRKLRRDRFEQRASVALVQLPGIPRLTPHRSEDATEFLHRLATDHLSSGFGSVPMFVVGALAEAHYTHHAVAAWRSLPLGAHAHDAAPRLATDKVPGSHTWNERHWLAGELERCIVLNTFVYCASRCAPWMFAADLAECQYVFANFPPAWNNAVPTRCMWISAQMGLLALHRRASSYALLGDRTAAYNDYYKLQRQLRNARRRVENAPLHIAGAKAFLTFLEARANQNIGELYRAEHAQRPALKHFQTALGSLNPIERDGEIGEVLVSSRWRIELQISHGKASYEMGQHKDALRWHLQAWRAFLWLVAAEAGTEANTDTLDTAIKWLDGIKFEPELRKPEALRHLRPIIDELPRIQVAERLGALAAEILLRLGHVLLVLRLDLAEPAIAAPESRA
jgi:tetratricopeptide (TPR) repeat protein